MKLLQIASFMIIIFIIAISIQKTNSSGENTEEDERVKRSMFVPYRTGKKVATQVSTALDHLLFFSGYDKQIRPQVRKILISSIRYNYKEQKLYYLICFLDFLQFLLKKNCKN